MAPVIIFIIIMTIIMVIKGWIRVLMSSWDVATAVVVISMASCRSFLSPRR